MKTLKLNDKGPQVSFLQITLKKMGIYSSNIDGIFGNNTKNSVIEFQKRNKLSQDGVVSSLTWSALLPYTTVPTNIPYTSDICNFNIEMFSINYPFLSFGSIGNSMLGKSIPYIRIGKGANHVIYVGSTHANEWITSPLLMKFIEDFSIAYTNNQDLLDKSTKKIFDTSSIFVVPMLNPDGVDLVTGDLDMNSSEYLNTKNIARSFPDIPFPSGWKANIIGIDINLQFPARWEDAKEIKYSLGYNKPAPRDFVGNYPLEISEAIAIYDFITSNNFDLILSYHTQGEVIYWKFLNYNPPKAKQIGELFSKLSGYALSDTPYASSFAGLKDWFIQNYILPGYTIEVGRGTNPLPLSKFDKIYNDNIGILLNAAII